ncbi:MAG: VapC toxin family PIN domain ribonuclease [Acidobacteria bacterium]|nr:MAG: VapC toxin family PIN domain ribonuclease [Acidobacteriota bacterium]
MGPSPLTKLNQALAGVTKLGFDTPPVIYFIEAHASYDALVTEIFQQVSNGIIEGITSVITLTEVLIHPLRREDAALQTQNSDLLVNASNFQTLPIDIRAALIAADLRARYNLHTPDAFQVATAITAGCEAFLTNDAALQRIRELRVLVLDQLEL